VADEPRRRRMGEAGRALVMAEASPAAVGDAYAALIAEVAGESLLSRSRR
jgi:hypothetical protein